MSGDTDPSNVNHCSGENYQSRHRIVATNKFATTMGKHNIVHNYTMAFDNLLVTTKKLTLEYTLFLHVDANILSKQRQPNSAHPLQIIRSLTVRHVQ